MRSDSRARRSDGGERVKLYNFSFSFLFFSRPLLSERLERATYILVICTAKNENNIRNEK